MPTVTAKTNLESYDVVFSSSLPVWLLRWIFSRHALSYCLLHPGKEQEKSSCSLKWARLWENRALTVMNVFSQPEQKKTQTLLTERQKSYSAVSASHNPRTLFTMKCTRKNMTQKPFLQSPDHECLACIIQVADVAHKHTQVTYCNVTWRMNNWSRGSPPITATCSLVLSTGLAHVRFIVHKPKCQCCSCERPKKTLRNEILMRQDFVWYSWAL
jgi:hypothetical protein